MSGRGTSSALMSISTPVTSNTRSSHRLSDFSYHLLLHPLSLFDCDYEAVCCSLNTLEWCVLKTFSLILDICRFETIRVSINTLVQVIIIGYG